MTALLALFANWRLALGALALAAFAALGLWARHQAGEIASLNARLASETQSFTEARQAAQLNADALTRLEARHRADLAAEAQHLGAIHLIERQKLILLDEVSHAPEKDDGPVAPVLATVLGRLRHDPTPNPDRAGGATGAAHATARTP